MGFDRARLNFLGFRLLSELTPRIPRGRGYLLADGLGLIAYAASPHARAAVRDNLRHVLRREPSAREIATVFQHGCRNYYDTFIIQSLTPAELLDLVHVPSWQPLELALAAGRGAIVAGVHLSSVALTGQVFAARGYRVTAPPERVDPPELNELLVRARSAGGVHIVTLSRDLTRELLATLHRNELVGLVMDRDIAGTGVSVKFFGTEASIPSGAALLAIRTGAPIVPAAAIRTPSNRFAAFLDEPIHAQAEGDLRSRIARTTEAVARRLERMIGAHPLQWTVFQPFWPQPGRSPEQATAT
jgi:KDO2-lipid IV(A) lauroyltransferase